MKAKEYFEKYFADLEELLKRGDLASLNEKINLFFQELSEEAIAICKARHSTSLRNVEGALKEQNQKYNSVANMLEQRHGRPIIKRNAYIDYWKKKLGG